MKFPNKIYTPYVFLHTLVVQKGETTAAEAKQAACEFLIESKTFPDGSARGRRVRVEMSFYA